MSHCDKYSILPRESEVVTIRKVDLTMNEQKKYEVIKNLVDSQGNKNRAAALLSCSRRTVDRLIMAYRQNGKAAFSYYVRFFLLPEIKSCVAKSNVGAIIL